MVKSYKGVKTTRITKTLGSFDKTTLRQLGFYFLRFKTPSKMTRSLAMANGRMYLLEEKLFANLETWKIDGMSF